MFDLATLPQPSTADPAAVFGVPFDWRIAQPSPASPYPFSDYSDPYVGPSRYVDMLATYSVALEDTLNTAVILSLFTDRRATDDDTLPLGQTDRRGWVGEAFMSDSFDSNVDAWGSTLWLPSGKATVDVLEQKRFAAQEALAWMVRDGLASRIEVTAQWVGERADRLALRPTIYEGGSSQPIYDVLWATSVRRWAS
jgi:phage gp46-like protein